MSVTVLGEQPSLKTQRFLALFRPHLGTLGFGLVWLAITNVLQLAVPRLVNETIATVERPHGGPSATGNASILSMLGIAHPTLVHLIAALVVCAVVGGLVRVLSRTSLFNLGREVERDLRAELFAHLSTLSPTYYKRGSVGDLMSRLTNDMTNIRLMAGFALLNALNAAIVFVATIPILFMLDAKVAALSLLPFPLAMLLAKSVTRAMFSRTKENQEALGKLTSLVQENLAGQQVVRAFSQEDKELARFAEKNDALYRAAMRLATVRLYMGPVMGLMGSAGVAIALYVGGKEILAGNLDVGDVVEINTRLIQLTWPTMAMGFIISVYQRGKASLARINEILLTVPDIVDGAVDRPPSAVRGEVSARALTVRPAPGAPPALVDFSAQLGRGQILGIVGKNASGKSTFVRALARQVPVDRGQLFLDDVDVNDWHLRALHGAVAVVPEDGFLFSATLRENLAFGAPDATDAEVERVVDLVDLRRDVRALKDGLQTVVGERGVTLSGGQRQRVALGRALLVRPRVLLLDDCLSAVDAETEARIVAALRTGFVDQGAPSSSPSSPPQPPTLIIVSHRLSAVRTADEIVSLDAGKIVERGTHDVLLKAGGLYASLWGEEQLRRALDAAPVAGAA